MVNGMKTALKIIVWGARIIVGCWYFGSGVLITNGLWLLPQHGENHAVGVILIMLGIGVLLGAICAHHGEE